MMQSPNIKIRTLSLELMGIALRQGLVNPNEVVPFLFALQGDIDNAPIRSIALQLLIAEGEKRPDILRQRMRAGVKEAYRFQRRIYPNNSRASALVQEDGQRQCIFSKIFEQSIVKNRKLREGFFKSLLKLYEHDRVSHHSHEDLNVSLLMFVTEVLAYLPFQSTMDPLFIIHHVSEIVALQGQQLCERFADFLRPHGLASKDEFDDNISNEDLLEQAARSKFPTRAKEAKALNLADFNIEEFGKMCKEGFVLALLIRLKSYLRARYGLTMARCLEYDPTAKERPCDKAVVKSSNFKDFNNADSPDDASFQDGDSMLRYYALFRRSIREDSQSNEAAGHQEGSPALVKAETTPKKRLSPELECVA
jgi:Sister chromatid cohesion C-terminus